MRVFDLPEIKERLKSSGYMLALSTPDEHYRIPRADVETFAGVVRLAGLRPR